jgi:PhnB protein
MKLIPILSFQGDCEEAFKFYERCLGAQPGALFRYGGSPMAGQVPPDWADKVMHANLTIGNQLLQASDVLPAQYEAPKGFSLSLQIKSADDAERIFGNLADNGTVMLPLQKTFWAERFGMVVDRFGVPWLINCEGQDTAATVG